ncbi:MAG: MATE family efflux transporter [Candidatus Fermentithermobacillus carboniphilus]|uniref:Probable multidrug resistance protein NorM n=1 Tax=Candidatus Fermentithermobacillus carboniphilus TaxID=3085328 RepID=A0AAT9LAF8_9FIRM|nr:MAG: MATE family efflux transporter [Candidatus Fermentithermobacillus carboniphilus]
MSRKATQVAIQDQTALSRQEVKHIVWTLTFPTLVEMFLVSLTGMADMIQVGRVGPSAITSVGLTNQPMMLLQSIFQALNVGTTALVARFIGMGEPKRASDTMKQTFFVTILLGLVISLFAGITAPWILKFMGAEEDVIAVGTPYFRVVGYGFIFNAIAMAIASALRGAGDTRTPMTVNLFANLVNIVFNWILIWGKFGFPRWGVFGAGVATTFSRFVACVWFIYIAVKGEKSIKLDLRERYRPDINILKRIYNIGLPAALEQLVLRSGQVMFAKVVSSLGTVTFAAHQVGMNILSLTFMPGQAFATAATTLVGQYLGAERPDDAERCANTSLNMGLIVGVSMAIVFLFFGKYIAMLYSDDMNVILVSALILKIYALAQPAQSTQFILAGGLRGAGDTKYPLYSTAIGMWLGRVFLGWFFVNVVHLGLPGAWLGMAADQIVRGFLIALRFKSGKWKTAKV